MWIFRPIKVQVQNWGSFKTLVYAKIIVIPESLVSADFSCKKFYNKIGFKMEPLLNAEKQPSANISGSNTTTV